MKLTTELYWASKPLKRALASCGIVGLTVAVAFSLAPQEPSAVISEVRDAYQINLKIDFDSRSYTGTEKVRWTNRERAPFNGSFLSPLLEPST